MRVMVLVKATADSEAGFMPSTELLEAMGNFNEKLVNAGVLISGEGLHPSSQGKRVASTALPAASATGRSRQPGSWWQASGFGKFRTLTRLSSG